MRLASLSLCAALAFALSFPARAAWLRASAPDPFNSAAAAYRAGRYQDVIKDLSPQSLQNVSPKNLELAYQYLAASYERSGRPDQALGVYQLGVKLYPKDGRLLADLGGLLHRARLNEQAKPLFDEALALNPNNAQANLGVAEIDEALGFLRRSRDHYFKALNGLAPNAAVWSEYAEVLWRLKDYPMAEDAARESLSISSSTQTEVLLAFIQRSDGRLPDAIATLAAAGAQSPKRTDVVLTRALWMIEDGRWNEALALDEKILAASPGNPLALWIRASVRLRQGRVSAARADLKRAAQNQAETPFIAAVSNKMLKALPLP